MPRNAWSILLLVTPSLLDLGCDRPSRSRLDGGACVDPRCIEGLYEMTAHTLCEEDCDDAVEGESVLDQLHPIFYVKPQSYHGRDYRLSVDSCESTQSCEFRGRVSWKDWMWFLNQDSRTLWYESSVRSSFDEQSGSCIATATEQSLTAPDAETVRIVNRRWSLAWMDAEDDAECDELQPEVPELEVIKSGDCTLHQVAEGRWVAPLPD